MPAHDYHDVLPGYDPRQILVDGCGECEHRAQTIERAVLNLDAARFARAWYRAYNLYAYDGRTDEIGPLSDAELPLLKALWAIQVQLERRGVPVGEVPEGPQSR